MSTTFSPIRWWSEEDEIMKHLTYAPPVTQVSVYANWLADDYCVMFWLLNSMEAKESVGVMFSYTAKKILDILKEMYANENNVSRVFELYEQFTLRMGDMSLPEYYSILREILDKLDACQPFVTDLWVLKRYCEDLAISKFYIWTGSFTDDTCL